MFSATHSYRVMEKSAIRLREKGKEERPHLDHPVASREEMLRCPTEGRETHHKNRK